jgi:hypothetical protein
MLLIPNRHAVLVKCQNAQPNAIPQMKLQPPFPTFSQPNGQGRRKSIAESHRVIGVYFIKTATRK